MLHKAETTYTQAPWVMVPDGTAGMGHEIRGGYVTIARVYSAAKEHVANARLISLAPEVLNCLRKYVEEDLAPADSTLHNMAKYLVDEIDGKG